MSQEKDKIVGIAGDSEHPEEMSLEEAKKKFGAEYGPCRICGGDSHFYITEPSAEQRSPLSEDIVPGNYCGSCFIEEYPESEDAMKGIAARLDAWMRKRFSQ